MPKCRYFVAMKMNILDVTKILMQRVPVSSYSHEEIMDLLSSHGIMKRSAEEAEKDENFESWDHPDL